MNWRLPFVVVLFFTVLGAVVYVLVTGAEEYEAEQRAAAQAEEGQR